MRSTISILGCGWLGEPLAHHLIAKRYAINGSTTSDYKLNGLRTAGIKPFLLHLESLNNSISQFLKTDILIVNIPSKNIESFQNLILEIEKSTITKVLFISSTSVYEQSTEMITEKSVLKDSILVDIENLFINNSNFLATIVRFAGLMGYSRQPGRFFPRGKPIGNPDGPVNMIHRDDCIGIIERIIEMDIWNETFNACADMHPSRREFYTKAGSVIGVEAPVFDQNSSRSFKLVSNQKIKLSLNYTFKYPDLLQALEADLSRPE